MAASLKVLGRRYRDSRAKSLEIRTELDAAIAAARARGQTYSSISDEVGMSQAWVQTSVARSTSPD